MKNYLDELYEAFIGVIFSPYVLVMLVRIWASKPDENTARIAQGYVENIRRPKTRQARAAEWTVYLAGVALVVTGFVAGDWVWFYLAAIIVFAVLVELLLQLTLARG